MNTIHARAFVPNAVLVPASANWKDSTGQHVDHDKCTTLFIDGNTDHGEAYTQVGWENCEKPSFVLRGGSYFAVDAEGHEDFLCRAGLGIDDQEPVGGDRIQLLPDLWCVKEEETEYWAEDFLRKFKIKRIFGVYVFDRRKHVHVCEVTPSYERYFVGSQWESQNSNLDDERNIEEIDDAIRVADAQAERWNYMHVADVDRTLRTKINAGFLPPKGRSGGYRITGLVSVVEEEAIEEIREAMCNGDL